MSQQTKRSASASRTMVIMLGFLCGIPIVVIAFGSMAYRASRLSAQEIRRAQTARTHAQRERQRLVQSDATANTEVQRTEYDATQSAAGLPTRPGPLHLPAHRFGGRVGEPHYPQRIEHVEQSFEYEPRAVPTQGTGIGTVWVQKAGSPTRVQTTNTWVQQPVSHDARIMQLANELRELDGDDPGRESKMKELRQRLDLEFAQMHDRQAEQIRQTEERLEALKKLHDQRSQNRADIVLRRIDELLGKEDLFKWNPDTPPGIEGHASGSRPNTAVTRITVRPMTPGPDAPTGTQTFPRNRPASDPAAAIIHRATPRVGEPMNQPRLPDPDPDPRPAARIPASELMLPNSPRSSAQSAPRQRGVNLRDSLTAPVAPPVPVRPQPERPQPERPQPERPQPERATETLRTAATTPATLDQVTARSTGVAIRGSVSAATSLQQVFELARKAAAADMEYQESKQRLDRMMRSDSNDAGFNNQRRDLARQVTRLEREIAINEMEQSALADLARGELEFAEEFMVRAGDAREIAKRRVEQGIAPTDTLVTAEQEFAKAKRDYANARATVETIARAFAKTEDAPIDTELDLPESEGSDDSEDDPGEPETASENPGVL